MITYTNKTSKSTEVFTAPNWKTLWLKLEAHFGGPIDANIKRSIRREAKSS